MTKTKFKVDIRKSGSNNDEILKLVSVHNEGKSILSIPDFISYAICRAALLPFTNGEFEISRDPNYNNIFNVSEDGGKTTTLSIEEIELHELVETDKDDIKNVL
jgi:hypothetical protein